MKNGVFYNAAFFYVTFYANKLNNQYKTDILAMESMVVPSVYTAAPSVSPSYASAKVDASPAVGVPNAINIANASAMPTPDHIPKK